MNLTESHQLNWLAEKHLKEMTDFYEGKGILETMAGSGYREWLAHYYNLLIPENASVLEVGCGSGALLTRLKTKKVSGLDLSVRMLSEAKKRVPHGNFYCASGELWEGVGEKYDYIILSETLNLAADAQMMLARIRAVSHSQTRLLINFHSALWRPVLGLARGLGLSGEAPLSSWFAPDDVDNLLNLAGWEKIKQEARLWVPTRLGGFDTLCNKWLAPIFPWVCFSVFTVARCSFRRDGLEPPKPTVSVVVPARNEAGNIRAAVERTPEMGGGVELIFVEGNSTDNTWEEIQKLPALYPDKKIKCLQQKGKGKGDAVRAGFAAARGDMLMILDADLTMPPEELPKFYEVLVSGHAEFANGVRLVYPMEKEAMQFLNLCANKFFGLLFSWLLGQPIKDTLCGTKVLWKIDYEVIAKNREYFGDFDPFGDFDLLFGAGKLNLKISDVPIRYCERTYGTTNISRWKHGALLFKMAWVAATKLKFV